MHGQRTLQTSFDRMGGAIRFPAFLLAWSTGIVLLLAQLEPADAMLVQPAPSAGIALSFQQAAPIEVDLLTDPDDGVVMLRELKRFSGVLSGRWQPRAQSSLAPVLIPAVAHRTLPAPRVEKPRPVPVAGMLKTVRERPVEAPVTRGNARLPSRKTLARQALGSGQAARAYELLRPGVAAARNDSEYLGLLALAALQVGSGEEAVVLYRRLLTLEPDNERWPAGLAFAGRRLEKPDDAAPNEALATAGGTRPRGVAPADMG